MLLTERHVIKKSNKLYSELDSMSYLSKNLYNQALYRIRQHYFNTKEYLNYYSNVKQLTKEKQADYIALPAKIAQWVVKQVDQNFRSFFASLKSNKVNHKVSIPKYLEKNSRYILTFTSQAISRKELKLGYLKLSGCSGRIKLVHTDVRQIRVIPRNKLFVVEVIYNIDEKSRFDNDNYVGIDIGLNNLATVGGNKISPVLINGRQSSRLS